jgi:hypothetical protein
MVYRVGEIKYKILQKNTKVLRTASLNVNKIPDFIRIKRRVEIAIASSSFHLPSLFINKTC